jgi:hypothetical protein
MIGLGLGLGLPFLGHVVPVLEGEGGPVGVYWFLLTWRE